MLVGLLAYGVSLALFVVALRNLGSARTGGLFLNCPVFRCIVGPVVGGKDHSATRGRRGADGHRHLATPDGASRAQSLTTRT